MKNNFFVLNIKKLIFSILTVIPLIITCVIITNIVTEHESVNAEKRLLPIYSVETEENKVALTFDCAWGANDIYEIINTLNKNDIKATFFTVGDWVTRFPNEVTALAKANMEIGNHSFSHKHVNNLSYAENLDDMKKCNELIESLTDSKVKFYRGPYGEYNNTVINVANELDMKVIQWDVDTLDYEGKTPDEMCDRIKKKIRNGSIILMHNDTKYTSAGLQQIIDLINNLGYKIVPLDELIYHENYEINHEGRQISTK